MHSKWLLPCDTLPIILLFSSDLQLHCSTWAAEKNVSFITWNMIITKEHAHGWWTFSGTYVTRQYSSIRLILKYNFCTLKLTLRDLLHNNIVLTLNLAIFTIFKKKSLVIIIIRQMCTALFFLDGVEGDTIFKNSFFLQGLYHVLSLPSLQFFPWFSIVHSTRRKKECIPQRVGINVSFSA